MKNIKDWVFSQIISKSLVCSRPLLGSNGLFAEESIDEEFGDRGITLFLPLLTSMIIYLEYPLFLRCIDFLKMLMQFYSSKIVICPF